MGGILVLSCLLAYSSLPFFFWRGASILVFLLFQVYEITYIFLFFIILFYGKFLLCL